MGKAIHVQTVVGSSCSTFESIALQQYDVERQCLFSSNCRGIVVQHNELCRHNAFKLKLFQLEAL